MHVFLHVVFLKKNQKTKSVLCHWYDLSKIQYDNQYIDKYIYAFIFSLIFFSLLIFNIYSIYHAF